MIEWHIRQHSDLTISTSTGLLFQWDDTIPHNIFEMSTAVTSADECRFVGDSAYELGKVRNRLNPRPPGHGPILASLHVYPGLV